jgi:hypothetical protein
LSGAWIKHCKIAQNIEDGWTRFMLQKSRGFTTAGIARINDSIRTFIYCVLGAQVQARTAIIGQSGTSPDAQKQFTVNLHDAIYADLSIPDSIERYQNAINNSHSKLDFAIGSGLYMIPSDLVMKIGSLDNYNNNILIATDDMDFGVNNINNKQIVAPLSTSSTEQAPVTNFKNPTELLGTSSTAPPRSVLLDPSLDPSETEYHSVRTKPGSSRACQVCKLSRHKICIATTYRPGCRLGCLFYEVNI